MKRHRYRVAELTVDVNIDEALMPMALAKGLEPFAADEYPGEEDVRLDIVSGVTVLPEGELVASGCNDLGEARLYEADGQFSVGVMPCKGEEMRVMTLSEDFSSGILTLEPGDGMSGFVTDSMLRILFSQAIAMRGGFMVHASVVEHKGKGVLFMGCSGTGKSTHSKGWLREFAEDTSLINDDNPAIRVGENGEVTVYGTPWSGKTPCYRQVKAPVRGLVRIVQAPKNRYERLDAMAFLAVLPGVSVITRSNELYNRACTTLERVIEKCEVGKMECLPDGEAALECRRNLFGNEGE